MVETAALDPERQKQAKQYARIKRRLWLVDMLLGAAYAALWLALGWSVAIRNWLNGFTSNDWFLVAGYMLVFGGIYAIVTLPLGYYSDFVLPHRFGQSTQTLKDWIIDQFKMLLISLPIGLSLIDLVYLALRVTGDAWWLWTAGGILFFSVVMGNLAP